MKIEEKVVLTEREFKEIVMHSWVQGWYGKGDDNDDGKHVHADSMWESVRK